MEEFAWPTDRARTALLMARTELDLEISSYPNPTSGCDAQLDLLIVERRRVQAALEALDADIHMQTSRTP